MHTPQCILVFWFVTLLLASWLMDGTPREGLHRFRWAFLQLLIITALLVWGGFFQS